MMMPGSSFSNPNDRFKKPFTVGSGPMAPKPSPVGTLPGSPIFQKPLTPGAGLPTSPAATNPVPNPGMANYTQKVAQGIMTAKPPVPTAQTYTQPPMPKANVTTQPMVAPQAQTVTGDAPQPAAAQVTPQNQSPTPGQAPTPSAGLKDVGSLTAGGAAASSYINNQATKLGQDPGAITDAGKIYADRVTKGLQGDDPLVKNAQNTEDTAASRRQYMANQATQETLGQSHFAPGSAQYQRAMDKSQAGVNAANQEGQSAVNDYTRKRTADNMAAAQGLETQQYNRNADNLKNAIGAEDTARANAVGERTHTDAKATEAINGMPEGAPKNTVRNLIAGGMTPEEAVQTVIGKTGQVNEQYRGTTPGAAKVQGVKDEASAWVTATSGLKPGDAGYDEAVTKRMKDTDTAVQGPIQSTASAAEIDAIKQKERLGQPLTDTETTKMLAGGGFEEYKLGADNSNSKIKTMIGKTVNIGGQPYKVEGTNDKPMLTGTAKHGHTYGKGEVVTVTDSAGKKHFIANGKML